MSKNKHIFKHNQNDELYNYIELNRAGKILSYFKIEGRTLIRFDKSTNTKHLITFKSNVKLKQKFLSGESFVTVYDTDTEECVQYKMPAKEKEITLINNNISISDYGKFVVERWKKIKNIKEITSEPEKTLEFSNAPLFSNDIFPNHQFFMKNF